MDRKEFGSSSEYELSLVNFLVGDKAEDSEIEAAILTRRHGLPVTKQIRARIWTTIAKARKTVKWSTNCPNARRAKGVFHFGQSRLPILKALSTSGPLKASELPAATEVILATIKVTLGRMVKAGQVERVAGMYVITTAGIDYLNRGGKRLTYLQEQDRQHVARIAEWATTPEAQEYFVQMDCQMVYPEPPDVAAVVEEVGVTTRFPSSRAYRVWASGGDGPLITD
jgi:hypothetical protein